MSAPAIVKQIDVLHHGQPYTITTADLADLLLTRIEHRKLVEHLRQNNLSVLRDAEDMLGVDFSKGSPKG